MAKGPRGIQVRKPDIPSDPYIIRIKIALGPAQVIRYAAQMLLQTGARLAQFFKHTDVFGGGVLFVPSGMRMRMAMEFTYVIGLHQGNLGPAQGDIAGLPLSDLSGANGVIGGFWQSVPLPGCGMPGRAVPHPTGDQKNDGMKAELTQQRPGVYVVIQIAVIKGNQHRTRGGRSARQVCSKLRTREAAIAVLLQPCQLIPEMRGGDVDGPTCRGDMVVHQHRHCAS